MFRHVLLLVLVSLVLNIAYGSINVARAEVADGSYEATQARFEAEAQAAEQAAQEKAALEAKKAQKAKKAAKPAEVEPVKAADPAKLAATAQPAQPVKPLKPVKAPQPAKPIPPVQPPKPEQPNILLPVTAPDSMKGSFAAGINYPGLSLRYGLSKSLVFEGKYQTGEGISLYGPRVYYMFSRSSRTIVPFIGGGFDLVSFKGEVSEGTGFVMELFGGGEYFVNDRLSFQLDIGPAFINLTDKNYSIGQAGVEYVVNFGINYYFRPGGK